MFVRSTRHWTSVYVRFCARDTWILRRRSDNGPTFKRCGNDRSLSLGDDDGIAYAVDASLLRRLRRCPRRQQQQQQQHAS